MARNGVFSVLRDRPAFEPHEGLGDLEGVKSMDVHPRTGRLAFVKAETSGWSFRVSFRGPEGEVRLPVQRLFKARWNP